jgi:hypothetical protein
MWQAEPASPEASNLMVKRNYARLSAKCRREIFRAVVEEQDKGTATVISRQRIAEAFRLEGAQAPRFLVLHLGQGFQNAFGLEGRPVGEQFIQDGAQPVDVGGRRNRPGASARLLGGHVAGRADEHARLRQAAIHLHPFGQAEIGDVRPALRVEEDVDVKVRDDGRKGSLMRKYPVGIGADVLKFSGAIAGVASRFVLV